MTTAVLVALAFGGLLGLRFRVLVLVPATAISIAAMTANVLADGGGILNAICESLGIAAALQAGYLVGAAATRRTPHRWRPAQRRTLHDGPLEAPENTAARDSLRG